MKAWTTYQLETLKSVYNGMSNADIAKLIGKRVRAVSLAKIRLGLVKYHSVPYLPVENEFIIQHFRTMSNKRLADLLGRKPLAIKTKLVRMNLIRTPEEATKVKRGLSLAISNDALADFTEKRRQQQQSIIKAKPITEPSVKQRQMKIEVKAGLFIYVPEGTPSGVVEAKKKKYLTN